MSISELSLSNRTMLKAERYVAASSRPRFTFNPPTEPIPKWQRSMPEVLAQRSDFAITHRHPRIETITANNEQLQQYSFRTRNEGNWQVQIHETLLQPVNKTSKQ